MKVFRVPPVRLAAVTFLAAFVILLTGCSSFGGDQNTFAPKGDVASEQLDVFIWALIPATIILILVSVALLYIIVRFRQRGDEEALPQQTHGNTRLEIIWSVAPAILLLGLAIPMLGSVVSLGRAPADDALKVNVTGQRFSWSYEYPDIIGSDGKPLFIVGTPEEPAELHVPVGREIGLQLQSVDVLHSFWVPKLAGKQDVVPGRTNTLWFSINEPGTYPGQCAEFCGLLHAEMKLTVIGHTESDFRAWCEEALGLEPGAEACAV